VVWLPRWRMSTRSRVGSGVFICPVRTLRGVADELEAVQRRTIDELAAARLRAFKQLNPSTVLWLTPGTPRPRSSARSR